MEKKMISRLQVVADLDRYDCDEKCHCDYQQNDCPDPISTLSPGEIRFPAFELCW